MAKLLTAGLHSNQLELDALDGNVGTLHHHLSGERAAYDAGGVVQVASDEKPRQRTPLRTKTASE